MRLALVLTCLLPQLLIAQSRVAEGTVTYIAAGIVYTSLGRESGVQDSMLLHVVKGSDTVATLQVIALSSKSSSCKVIASGTDIRVGAMVVAAVPVSPEVVPPPALSGTDPSGNAGTPVPTVIPRQRTISPPPELELRGRISAQYHTTKHNNAAYNITQPGIVMNVRARTRDVPLTFDLYSNLRTIAYGDQNPFGGGTVNQSRIYRLSLTYDDTVNRIAVGRIAPTLAPSIGYVDGVLLARKFGDITLGTTLGFQPPYTQRGVSTDTKKMAVFTQLDTRTLAPGALTIAYSRTQALTTLDREVLSGSAQMSISPDLFLYTNSEVDLRKKSGEEFILDPLLTTAYMTLNYRLSNLVSVGVGGDASRPMFLYSSIRSVPDSLLDRSLRGGASVNLQVRLAGGISVFNTYTPRSSSRGFARDFSDNLAVSLTDVASTGMNVRTSGSLNRNEFAHSIGYGVAAQRSILNLFDLTIRFQRYVYTVQRTDSRNTSTTFGTDAMIPLGSMLAFYASYDRLDGSGTTSHTVFGELSVRF